MDIEELDCVCFYHGYARYAQWGKWGHVFTACYYDNDELKELTEDLSASDIPAIDASHKINKMVADGNAYLGTDKYPQKALEKCIDNIKKDRENG